MEKDMKCVFGLFHVSEEEAFRFNKGLSMLLHTPIHVKRNHGFFLSVPDSLYEEALIKGMELANQMHLSIKWINYYHHFIPSNYMSVMYGFLPETKRNLVFGNALTSNPMHPFEITEYINKLKNFLDVKNVMVQYRFVDNAVEILVEGPFSLHGAIQDKCREFTSVCTSTPFVKIMFTGIDGKVLTEEKKDIPRPYAYK